MKISNRAKEIISMAAFATVTVALFAFMAWLLVTPASCARWRERRRVEYEYGTPRRITLYDFNGEVVREWSGKCDVTYRSDGAVDLVFYTGDGEIERRTVVSIGHGQLIVETEDE